MTKTIAGAGSWRRVRGGVLTVLFAVTAVLGTVPAASAAEPFGLSWTNYGPVPGNQPFLGICATGTDFQPGQTVAVQMLTGTTWVTKRTYQASGEPWDCVQARPADVVPGPGRYALRAFTQVSPTAPVVEARTTITATAMDVYVDVSAPEFTMTTSANRVAARVSEAAGQIVELHRRDGTRWVAVARVRAPASGFDARLSLAVPSRVGNAAYRVVSARTTWAAQYVSETFTIHQTDYARYSGYIATARRYMARYCPQTPIYIDTPGVLPGQRAYGLARGESSIGAPGDRTLTTWIQLRSGMSGPVLAHVATHECAHIVQYRAVVEGRASWEAQRARAWFGSVAEEGQADCMAYQYVKERSLLAYLRDCSAGQKAEAARVWQAYGLKYQAATYRW